MLLFKGKPFKNPNNSLFQNTKKYNFVYISVATTRWIGSTTRSFSRVHIWDPAQLVVCGAVAAVCLACVIARARRTQGGKLPEEKQYLVMVLVDLLLSRSWSIATTRTTRGLSRTFMSLCFVISWAAGALDTFFHPTTWPLWSTCISSPSLPPRSPSLL